MWFVDGPMFVTHFGEAILLVFLISVFAALCGNETVEVMFHITEKKCSTKPGRVVIYREREGSPLSPAGRRHSIHLGRVGLGRVAERSGIREGLQPGVASMAGLQGA